jgi:hypothetical protein
MENSRERAQGGQISTSLSTWKNNCFQTGIPGQQKSLNLIKRPNWLILGLESSKNESRNLDRLRAFRSQEAEFPFFVAQP